GNTITDRLNADLNDDDVVINLASNEYFKAINAKNIKAPIININFKDSKDGKTRVVAIFAKIARGAMARAIIKNRITEPAAIQKLTVDDYRFQTNLSDDNNWVFTRNQPPPKS
ncbi:MAG: peroxide stress protein YaaA, partial [Proteobacteria bacterium]